MSPLKAIDPSAYCARKTALGQRVKSVVGIKRDLVAGKIGILGFPDDRGVALNLGNIGAKDGPDAFRKAFYNLNEPAEKQEEFLGSKLVDLGDIDIDATESPQHAHDKLSDAVNDFLLNGGKSIFVIGGGHDFSFGSYLGHCKAHAELEESNYLPIVNFDAHFDLRPVENEQYSSGTPFFRAIESNETASFLKNGKVLYEIGIQLDYNGANLVNYARNLGVPTLCYEKFLDRWFDLQDKQYDSPEDFLTQHLHPKGPIHLSIDLDVFDSDIACGTSAATPFAPTLAEVLPAILNLSKQSKVIDIAELCPSRDHNAKTARLAAGIARRIIRQQIQV